MERSAGINRPPAFQKRRRRRRRSSSILISVATYMFRPAILYVLREVLLKEYNVER
jgi:hypothetical protein